MFWPQSYSLCVSRSIGDSIHEREALLRASETMHYAMRRVKTVAGGGRASGVRSAEGACAIVPARKTSETPRPRPQHPERSQSIQNIPKHTNNFSLRVGVQLKEICKIDECCKATADLPSRCCTAPPGRSEAFGAPGPAEPPSRLLQTPLTPLHVHVFETPLTLQKVPKDDCHARKYSKHELKRTKSAADPIKVHGMTWTPR